MSKHRAAPPIFAAILALALLIAGAWPQAQTKAAMVYLFNAPESAQDVRYRFQVEILRAVLEKTQTTYGPYVLKASISMSESRQVSELKNHTGTITVIIRGASPDYAKVFRPVPIAIDKGILGYRVLLIRAQDQPRFSQVRSLEDLKAITIGQGSGWKDVDILRSNGLRVVTGPSYEGLFDMLAKSRFDAFSRGVEEIGDEYDAHRGSHRELAIEKTLLLHYPIPRYLWFGQDEDGRALAARAADGLHTIISNGTFDRIFGEFFKARLDVLQLPKRRLIELKNPYLPQGTPRNDLREFNLGD